MVNFEIPRYQSQAEQIRFGFLFEPGIEFNTITINKSYADAYGEFNLPLIIQSLFLDGPIRPYLSFGYSYRSMFWNAHGPSKGEVITYHTPKHYAILGAGVSFIFSHFLSMEAFGEYNFAPCQEFHVKVVDRTMMPAIEKEYIINNHYKLLLGARILFKIKYDFEIGFGSKIIFNYFKIKDANSYQTTKGYQANLSFRKVFSFSH